MENELRQCIANLNEKLKCFDNYSYNELNKIIRSSNDLFEQVFNIEKNKFEEYLAEKKTISEILEIFKEKEDNLLQKGIKRHEDKKRFISYVGDLDKDLKKCGEGVYNYNDHIIFIGEFENDFFKEGLLIRKTTDNSVFHIFIGTFFKENGLTVFQGIYYPHLKKTEEKQIAFIRGKIINNTQINGSIVYIKSINNKNEIVEVINGKINDYKKSDQCIIIKYEPEMSMFLGTFNEDLANGQCVAWKKSTYLLSADYINGKATDGTAQADYLEFFNGKFMGKIEIKSEKEEETKICIGSKGKVMFENNDIYTGEFSNGLKNNHNKYFIRSPSPIDSKLKIKYIIEAKFEEDKISQSAKVYKINDREEKELLFNGQFDELNQIKQGEYSFTSKEKFIGSFKNFMKQGKGRYIFDDGSILEGNWEENIKNGEFIYNKQGRIKEQKIIYKNDKPIMINI